MEMIAEDKYAKAKDKHDYSARLELYKQGKPCREELKK